MAEPTLARTAAAFLRRDLIAMASYRFGVVMRAASLVAVLVSFVWLARFIGADGTPSGTIARYGAAGYVGFWVVGVSIADLFNTCSAALALRVRTAQLEGTLEAMLATPAPAAHVVLSAPLADLLFAGLRLVLNLAVAGLFLGVDFGAMNAPAVAITAALALAAFLSLGLLGGAMAMTLRRTDPISLLVGLATMVIGGVFFPVSVLPPIVRDLAYALPAAPALEALRLSLFAGVGPADLWRELGALALFTAVVAPLGGGLFARAIARARADGSLGTY